MGTIQERSPAEWGAVVACVREVYGGDASGSVDLGDEGNDEDLCSVSGISCVSVVMSTARGMYVDIAICIEEVSIDVDMMWGGNLTIAVIREPVLAQVSTRLAVRVLAYRQLDLA